MNRNKLLNLNVEINKEFANKIKNEKMQIIERYKGINNTIDICINELCNAPEIFWIEKENEIPEKILDDLITYLLNNLENNVENKNAK